uniref:Transmembrane protein 14C n=1 Tax=Cyprinus carpio TaxID=7962 RepID=A0A8C2B5P0_CYPCA
EIARGTQVHYAEACLRGGQGWHRVISLVAGLMFGIAAFVGAHQMSKNDKDIWVSLGTCGSLTALMGVRFLSLWKIMPAGLMAARLHLHITDHVHILLHLLLKNI